MRSVLVVLLALGCLLSGAAVAEAAKPKDAKKTAQVDLSDAFKVPALSTIALGAFSELQLTADQKKEVDKLQSELAAKLKELDVAANAPPDPAAKGKKGKGGKNSVANDARTEAKKAHDEAEIKFIDLLTDEQ